MSRLDIRDIITSKPIVPEWLVEGIFCRGRFNLIAGLPGVGKSMLSYNLAMCVASGSSFLGYPTAQGRVLYIDEENSLSDLYQYLNWTWHGLDKPDIEKLKQNLFIESFTLASKGHARYTYLEEQTSLLQPIVIVIDTATPACGLLDENDNSEASRAIQRLKRIRSIAGDTCSLIVLKHEKFTHRDDLTRSIRGAKTWLGEVDAVFYHTAKVGRPRKDGLRTTYLEADKIRAYGPREIIEVVPSWTPNRLGLKLSKKEGKTELENNSPQKGQGN